ncbi:MAG TPA: bifunctional DNA-binding transcriptional regulator/O6-methylguanine-DNA methyltransferase Ada [Terriglobales bacterium]|nr:bifunctional DNA-binding transcriptional regulator/O6-methylguanine-DNA methyltransferase Ada [Terriglobales bacterium]
MISTMIPAPTDAFWQAVLSRDRRFDRVFVYGVGSTGVYCRPSCPSRRPRPEKVEFFDGPEAAERSGFRACRRCRPREIDAGDPKGQLVQKLCRLIDRHLDQPLSLQDLADQAGLSPFHLQKTFKQVLGISPREYADARRLLLLKSKLRHGDDVTTAVYDAGYGSSSRVYERAPGHLGMTPGSYRQGAPGITIRYTITDSPLGRMLVASTARGLCAVRFADSDRELESGLRQEFPKAEIVADKQHLRSAVGRLLSHLDGDALDGVEPGRNSGSKHIDQHPDLPLDVRATAFQWRVWKALRQIPRGSTRSYAEIARAIRRPRAVRAVARACAANPVAVLIPCHRVVRSDGEPGGYRWGAERKRALLAREKAIKG